MSKTLEQVAKESAKNSRMPLTTQGGYIFEEGFIAGAEHVKKEYEEKLRWIPVEEKLPENKELVLVKTNRNCVSTAYLHGKISGFITYGEEAFVDFGSITHWRSIFL